MKKNVLFISSLFPSPSDPFMATFNLKIVRAMEEHMHPVVIAPVRWVPFTKTTAGGIARYEELVRGLEVQHPRLFLQPFLGRSIHWLLYFLCIYRPARRALAQNDIHCIYSAYAYPDGVACALMGMLAGTKVVVHVMGCDINYMTRFLLRRKVIVWGLQRASRIICVSFAMKRSLISLGISPDKIEVVYNGVDKAVFKPMPREKCRSLLNMPADEKNILFVGSLEQVKGIPALLEAFRLLVSDATGEGPAPRLYLIGQGSLLGEIRSYLEKWGLVERVQLLGNRPSEEVALWMNACDVFCLPSIREGLPNVILEAISCGRPIVATDVGGIPELLAGYELGSIVSPNAPEDLCMSLKEILYEKTPGPAGDFGLWDWSGFSAEVDRIISAS